MRFFPELSTGRSAKERIVTPEQVVELRPDIIIGSWCGKRSVPAKVRAREGFADIPAVETDELHEIKSTIILQPGPAVLTDGLDALQAIIEQWSRRAEEERPAVG
jgi:iron complex transport system substrate-binding protein